MTARFVKRFQNPQLTKNLGGTARNAHGFGMRRKPRFFLEYKTGDVALGELQREGQSARTSSDNGDGGVHKENDGLILSMLKSQCFILCADFDFVTRFEFAR